MFVKVASVKNSTKNLNKYCLQPTATIRTSNNTCNDDEKLVYQTSNDISGIELLEDLISNEENYVANMLLKCMKLCPSAFGKQSTKADIIKLMSRGTRALWTSVGSTLEHVVLWWSNAPLACRPSACAKYLRDWLLIIQPDGIFSILCLYLINLYLYS